LLATPVARAGAVACDGGLGSGSSHRDSHHRVRRGIQIQPDDVGDLVGGGGIRRPHECLDPTRAGARTRDQSRCTVPGDTAIVRARSRVGHCMRPGAGGFSEDRPIGMFTRLRFRCSRWTDLSFHVVPKRNVSYPTHLPPPPYRTREQALPRAGMFCEPVWLPSLCEETGSSNGPSWESPIGTRLRSPNDYLDDGRSRSRCSAAAMGPWS
jgi:hypothetical protein